MAKTISSIDTNDDITYGTGIVECHFLTGELRIITNSELRKLVSKGPNFHEGMSVNWNKCKREIEIGLDSSIERIVSTNSKVTTEEFVEWKRKIL